MNREKIKSWILPLLFLGSWALTSFSNSSRIVGSGKIRTIIIDAGHGGKDPGCHGVEANEKNVTLSIVLKLRDILKENCKDMKVILTRDDDTFVELFARAKHAGDNNADFFVSIHCNANPNKEAFGTESYVMGLYKEDANLATIMNENKTILMEENYEENYEGFDPTDKSQLIYISYVAGVQLQQSALLASKVEKQFKDKVGRNSRGVKQAGFLVLWKSSKPSILIETGFLTNVDEEKFLNSETGQDYIANAVYHAIAEYNKEVE